MTPFDYAVDEERKDAFYEAISRYLPGFPSMRYTPT
jgi:hypothetical protein